MLRRIALCALLAVAAAGCTGDSEPAGRDDIDARLRAAKTHLDEAASIRFTLRTEDMPEGVDGITEATGVGTHAPAFEGEISVSAAGMFDGQTVEVVAVDGKVYAQTPFSSSAFTVDPAEFGAPDPATLMDTETGLSTLLSKVTDVSEEDQSRDGDTVVTEFSGTLPGEVMAGIFPTASGDEPFEVVLTLTDDDVLRTATITGPFYGDGGDVTYDVRFEASDEAVEITKP